MFKNQLKTKTNVLKFQMNRISINTILLILSFISCAIRLNAQEAFLKEFGILDNENAHISPTVLETGDDGYFTISNGAFTLFDPIASGQLTDQGPFSNYLIKYDLNGNLVRKSKSTTPHLLVDMSYSSSGSEQYLYALESKNEIDVGTNGFPAVVKINANNDNNFGSKLWHRLYIPKFNDGGGGGAGQLENTSFPQSIISYHSKFNDNSDEGCIVTCYLRKFLLFGQDNTVYQDYLLIYRLDASGSLIWSQFIPTSSYAGNRTRMVQNEKGIYVLYNRTDQNGLVQEQTVICLDNNTGDLIKKACIYPTFGSDIQLYDIATNGSDIVMCGRVIHDGRTDNDGVIVKMNKDLWTIVNSAPYFIDFWQVSLSSPNDDEVFFRIIYEKNGEYSIGGSFIPNGSSNRTISSLSLKDIGNSCLINNHTYLNTSSGFALNGLIFTDMECDLSCGSLFLMENVDSDLGPNHSTALMRVNKSYFQCGNSILSNNLRYDAVWPLDKSNLNVSGVLEEYASEYVLSNFEFEVFPICETCSSSYNIPFNISIYGKGNLSNGCVGDKLIAPECYVYYEWYKDGQLLLKTLKNEVIASLEGSYLVKCYYSENCFDFSNYLIIRPNPQPNFTFNDNCINALSSIFTNTTPSTPNISSTEWKFGDGSTSNNMGNASHTYSVPGIFNVTLRKMSNYGCIGEITKPIKIYNLPQISFGELNQLNNYNPYMAVCLTSGSNWTGIANANLGQTMANWEWNFDDPNQTGVISGQNANFSFSREGSHKVTLTVTSDKGCKGTASGTFDVYIPKVTISQDNVCSGNNVTLNASVTSKYGKISSYDWQYNSVSQGTGSQLTINNMTAGTYTYKLKVWDSYGCIADQTKIVQIFNKPLVSYTNTTSCASTVTGFTGTASSAGSNIAEWKWDFTDGSSATTQNASHIYSSYGTYYPVLTVKDGRGCTNSHSHAVSVLAPPAVPVISSSPSGHNFCEGDVVTLNVSNYNGSHKLLWSASYPAINGSTAASVTYVAPGANTTEIVGLKVTDPVNGCYTYAITYPLYTHILDVRISSNSSNNNLCAGSNITLSGFVSVPQQHYQWQVSNDNGVTWNNTGTDSKDLNVTMPGWYRYEASNSTGCKKYSSYIIIRSAGALTISDNLAPSGLLSPPFIGTQLSISTNNAPNYSQIQWFRNDIPLASGQTMIQIDKPGDYYVVAQGCGIERSNLNFVQFDDNSGNWDQTYISGLTVNTPSNLSSPPGTGYIIDGDITVNAGGNLYIEAVIDFKGCHRITVKQGGILTITNSSVISAGTQWEGIYVEDGGTLVISNNSDISDAVVGVYSKDGGSADIQNSTFGRNIVHMVFDNYDLLVPAFISNNDFGHVIDAASTLQCQSHTEYNALNIPRGNQIYIRGTNASQAITIMDNNAWLSSKYSGSQSIWLSATGNRSLNIGVNTIKGFYDNAIRLTDCNTAQVSGNIIYSLNEFDYGYACPCSPRGTALYFKNTEQSSIGSNYLKRWRLGMEYYEDLNGTLSSTIQNNKFIDGIYGLVIAPVAYPIGSANSTANKAQWTNKIYVNITCNLFDGNEIGIIGSGLLRDQGTSLLSAGNRFKSNGVPLNSIYSTLWNYSLPLDYYYSNIPNPDDETVASNPSFQVTIDGNQIDKSNNKLSGKSGGQNSSNSCTNSLFRSTQNVSLNKLEDSKAGPYIYPNPVSSWMSIDNLSGSATIKLYSLEGKLLGEWNSEEDKTEVNLDFLDNGLYIIYVSDSNGTAAFRILKVSNG